MNGTSDLGLDLDLATADPALARIIGAEEERQRRKLVMIASESIAPRAVREALATCLANLYAEGYPSTRMCAAPAGRLEEPDELLAWYRRYGSRRYYKGVEHADFVEALARRRAARLFANDRVPEEGIHANVQPLSGAAANNAVYEAFLSPGDPVMGMDLTYGGHLTHGHQVNRSGKHYRVSHYRVGSDGKLDYEAMARLAAEVRPKLVIAGFSAYPWDVDWRRMREVADAPPDGPAVLLADISHTAGLVAAGVLNSPVGYADVVTMTTHKTLCGPRGAIILTTDRRAADRIDTAVFPGEQGGPHVHQVAAKAVAFRLADGEEFRALMRRVAGNAAALAAALAARGVPLAYGGTNTHMLLVELKKMKSASGDVLSGEIASRLLDLCGVTCNKNTIGGDTSAFDPGAIRLGTTWLTQRGFGPAHMERIAALVARLLGSAESFRYIGAFGDMFRVKVEPGAMREARAEVASLIEEVEGKGAAAGAAPEGGECDVKVGAILVEGERAHLLLDHVLSAPVAAMAPGDRRAAGAFDWAGVLVAEVVVRREEDGGFGGRRFRLDVGGGDGAALLGWMRSVSDGYVRADPADVHAKACGPAVVSCAGAEPRGGKDRSATAWAPEVDFRKPFFVGRRALLERGGVIVGGRRGTGKKKEFAWSRPAAPAKETCLYEEHLKLVERKRIAEFAGWKLPLWFSGIAQEHRAVRRAAGLFDVSHMGVLEFSGTGAEQLLDMTTTAFTPALAPGQAKYSYLLAPDGRVIDDIMLYRLAAERFVVVVNAANADEDEAWWRAAADGGHLLDAADPDAGFHGEVRMRDLKDRACGDERRVDLALQGPASTRVLRVLVNDAAFMRRVEELRRFEFAEGEVMGADAIVARTGYTGEQVGYELLLHPAAAPTIWNALLQAGAPLGALPCGLGARDSTRTQAGLPLHGHELAGEHAVNPVEAGYGSFVKLHKPFFVGRGAMVRAATARSRVVVRFTAPAGGGKGQRLIRPGHLVMEGRKGRLAGTVTSCTMAGDAEIGMALVDARFAAPETPLAIFTCTDKDGVAGGKPFSKLAGDDWLPVARQAVVVPRFPPPANPFPEEGE